MSLNNCNNCNNCHFFCITFSKSIFVFVFVFAISLAVSISFVFIFSKSIFVLFLVKVYLYFILTSDHTYMIKLNGSLLGFILFVLATFLFLQTNISRMSKADQKEIEIASDIANTNTNTNTNIFLEKEPQIED